jgi:hypothetical protein
MTFQTEFTSFPIKRGKEARAQERMGALRQHHAECVKTLDRESMHFESIFRSVLNGITYLSWLSVQGTAGAHVDHRRSPWTSSTWTSGRSVLIVRFLRSRSSTSSVSFRPLFWLR